MKIVTSILRVTALAGLATLACLPSSRAQDQAPLFALPSYTLVLSADEMAALSGAFDNLDSDYRERVDLIRLIVSVADQIKQQDADARKGRSIIVAPQ